MEITNPSSFKDFIEAQGLQDETRNEAVEAYTIALAEYQREVVNKAAESGTVKLMHYTPGFMKKIIERSQTAA